MVNKLGEVLALSELPSSKVGGADNEQTYA